MVTVFLEQMHAFPIFPEIIRSAYSDTLQRDRRFFVFSQPFLVPCYLGKVENLNAIPPDKFP